MKTSFFFRFKLILLVAFFGIVSSCSNDDDDDDNVTYDLTGSWKVTAFVEGNGQQITKSEENTYMNINNGDITITFEAADDSGVGRFQGISVTNGYTGNYTVDMSGEIIIGTITTTFVAQPEWADLFIISDAVRYEIRNTNLLIHRKDNRGSITFKKS